NSDSLNGTSMDKHSLNGTLMGDRDSLAEGIPMGKESLNGTSVGSKHRWIKVTDSELDDYRAKETKACRRPFEHCCLGQGRQLLTNSFNDTSHLEVKWSGPTSDLTSVLDAMHDNNVPCNLFFVGMSTSGDMAIGSLCELLREDYTLDDTNCVAYPNHRWAEGHKLNCTNSQADSLQQLYHLTNTNRSKCPEVTISHTPIPLLEKGLNSIDAFWKHPGSGVGFHGWETMFRETEHQHFATSNGYYEEGVANLTSRPCRPIVNNSDYRTTELHDLVRSLNETTPIIALEEATRPLHYMHGFDVERSIYDCTHYTFTPWKHKLTWQGILDGLRTLNAAALV
ncbi:hypothetical protein THAOC_04175, partial [Thalassiosira oceanica]